MPHKRNPITVEKVLPKTAAALERLAATGVAVAFSTGRGLAELSDYVPNLPFIKYGSCISGGLVYDFSNQRTVFAHPFETKLALEVMALARQEAPMVHILTTTQSVAATEQNRGQEAPWHRANRRARVRRASASSDLRTVTCAPRR